MNPTHLRRKPVRRWPVAAAVIGGWGCGYLLHRLQLRPPEAIAATVPALIASPAGSRSSRHFGPTVDAQDEAHTRLLRELKQRIEASTPFDDIHGSFSPPDPAVQDFLRTLAQSNPRLALRLAAEAAPDSVARYKLFTVVARTWAQNDPDSAWQWAQRDAAEFDRPEMPSLRSCILEGMAVADSSAAVERVDRVLREASSNPDFRPADLVHDAVTGLLRAGRLTEAQRASLAWFALLPPDDASIGAVTVLAQISANQAPRQSERWLPGLAESPLYASAVTAFAGSWGAQDPRAAVQWATGLEAASDRSTAIRAVLAQWSHSNVAAAAEWLVDGHPELLNDDLVLSLLQQPELQAASPRAALILAETLPDSDVKVKLMRSALRAWTRNEPETAAISTRTDPAFTAARERKL